MDVALRKHCQTRKAALIAERDPQVTDWQQIADYVDPWAGRFLRRNDDTSARKQPSRSKIINSAGAKACRTMDAGFMGGHTSKARPWFIVKAKGVVNEQSDVRAWCDDVAQAIRDVLANSNFYTALPEFYHSRHLFGIAAMACVTDAQEVVRFFPRPIGTYAAGLNERGQVDSLYYSYTRTARQLEREFGEDVLPEKVKRCLTEGKGDTKFTVETLVEPNPDKRDGLQPADRRPYRQVYWIAGGDAENHGCLEVAGYYENPMLVGRWLASASDVYVPSPALEALGDIKQLQYLEGEKLRLIDLMAQPPLSLPETMRGHGASLAPGSRVYVTPGQTQQGVTPIYTPDPRGLQAVQQEIAEVQQRVEAGFFADLFRMLDFLDDRERTAFEISERKEEKIAMLSPALEALTDEVLDPAIKLVYAHMDRAGLIPPAPEALVGQPVQIEYTSVLAQAQKALGLGSIERTIGFVGQVAAATQNPAVWDKLDLDQTIDEFHDRAGSPARMVRSDDDVAEIRGQRAQQQRMEQMQKMAPAIKQGAEAIKTLGDAVPQEGSAIEGLAGALAGGL